MIIIVNTTKQILKIINSNLEIIRRKCTTFIQIKNEYINFIVIIRILLYLSARKIFNY